MKINNCKRKLFDSNNHFKLCENISPYLTDSPTIFIESRSTPICNVSHIRFGSMPRDGGGFVLSEEERADLIKKEPLSEKWIKRYIGANEFLNNKNRYCLWLVNASPNEIKKCPTVLKRVESVREFRAASKAAGTRKFAKHAYAVLSNCTARYRLYCRAKNIVGQKALYSAGIYG